MIPEEENLTNAEKKVLAAFRVGHTKSDVACAEIRGDFLRGLFLGGYDKEADYRGTIIVRAIISDVLDMAFREAKFPVWFHACLFTQEIKIEGLTCPELGFDGCTLKKGINAIGAKVIGGVHLTKVKAMDQVWLSGADIGGQLDCDGGSFQNKGNIVLAAQRTKVASDVFLRDGFKAEGVVILAGADIGGQLVCTGGSFQNEGGNALIAQGIKVASDVLLIPHEHDEEGERENFSANGLMSFANASIGGDLYLIDCKLTHLLLAGANVSGKFQDNAEVYKDENGGDIVLNIDGFRYQRLVAVKERVKDRLEWVGSMSKGDEFRPQPYEQLMKVYREMGHMNWARRVGFELEKQRNKVMGPMRKARHWFLRLTIGYGYKPFRILWWFPFAIVSGLLLFSGVLCPQKWASASVLMSTLGNGITVQSECERWRMLPSDVEALLSPDWRDSKIPPEGYPKFIPLFYAIEVALPVLALGQTGNWQPKSPGIKWIQGIIIIIGAVALAIPASYRTGILSPRWWDE